MTNSYFTFLIKIIYLKMISDIQGKAESNLVKVHLLIIDVGTFMYLKFFS